jgi:methylglyoxal synthase
MTEYTETKFHLALIAHDRKKDELVQLALQYKELLTHCQLVTTATTGGVLNNSTGLSVYPLLSGPLGGDLQMGSLVATGKIERVIFLRDPLTAHPHEPDIAALMKVCDIYKVPLATNLATAKLVMADLARDSIL